MFALISLLTSAGEVNGISALSCWMASGSTSLFAVELNEIEFFYD
jgi:hypothetical protein